MNVSWHFRSFDGREGKDDSSIREYERISFVLPSPVYLAQSPVAQSRGADLADWLLQHPAPDPVYHAITRLNMYEDVTLPTGESDAFQSLSFNLKGLAACLETLPSHQVLRLPPPLWTGRRESPTSQVPLESSFPDSFVINDDSSIGREASSAAEFKKSFERGPERKKPSSLPTPGEIVGDASAKTKPIVAPEDLQEESQLDMLLEMSPGPRGTAGMDATVEALGPGENQSLEDWLESL